MKPSANSILKATSSMANSLNAMTSSLNSLNSAVSAINTALNPPWPLTDQTIHKWLSERYNDVRLRNEPAFVSGQLGITHLTIVRHNWYKHFSVQIRYIGDQVFVCREGRYRFSWKKTTQFFFMAIILSASCFAFLSFLISSFQPQFVMSWIHLITSSAMSLGLSMALALIWFLAPPGHLQHIRLALYDPDFFDDLEEEIAKRGIKKKR